MPSNLPEVQKENWAKNEIVMPDNTNSWGRAINTLSKAVPIYASNGDFYTVQSYKNNTITLIPLTFPDGTKNETPLTYLDGMNIIFKATFTNTGECSVTVNELGTKQIKNIDNTLLKSDTITPGDYINLRYDKLQDCFYLIRSNSGGSGLEVGDIIIRNTPTNDAGKHLLDGALIQHGSYQAFVDYIADLYNNTPVEDVCNVNIAGSLTNNNGVLSGFSTSNYAKLPTPFSPSNKNWEVVVPVTTASSFVECDFFASVINGDFGIHVQFHADGKLALYLSSSGTSHDIASNVTGASILLGNTKYWIKVVFSGTSYIVYSSTTGEFNGEEITEITVNSSAVLCTMTTTVLGRNPNPSYPHPFNGSIDLNGCYINIYGRRWWSGKTERRAGFLTEDEWQQIVATYGSCGKYVYDSVNNTVRLPKVSDILQGTTDLTALGDLIEAGLPDHNHYTSLPTSETDSGSNRLVLGNGGNPTTHSYISNNASASNSIYGNSNTVQPQTIKVLYYIVIANSTKTDIQVNIDQIATDLNGKADVDLTNVNNAGTSKGAGWAMPSDTYVDLTLGASGTTYTAPANGWFWVRNRTSLNGGGLTMQIKKNNAIIYETTMKTVAAAVISDSLPVKKGAILTFYYDSGTDTAIRFIYAQGSESEA